MYPGRPVRWGFYSEKPTVTAENDFSGEAETDEACRHKAKVNSSTEIAEVASTELAEVLGPTRSFGWDALRRVLARRG